MSLKKNIIYLYFKGKHLITSKSQYQYNHGQYLYFADLNLPQAFEVHFSNKDMGESKTQIGSNKLVEIPDEYFWSGALEIYAWVYLHDGTDDGETIYEVRIPLIKRAKPTDEEPLPVQQSAIDRAIAELNNAVDITNENADKTNADKTQVATIKEEVITLKEEIDSTASAVSQNAQTAQAAAERSEQSAQNSAESERKALDYSDEAKGYAQSALESKNTASQKAQVATDASAEAKDFRDEAETFKNEAEQAKQNIVDYRNETKGYRDEALTAKNDAQDSANAAQETSEQMTQAVEEIIESVRDLGSRYATQAETAANNAGVSAESASSSAQASAQSASQAEQIKADVEDLADDAQGYATASANSASASDQSATRASESANSASASANTASSKASEASGYAQTASQKATEASGYANTSSQKALESANSASQASGYATQAESAKTSAQTAQGLAESARDSAISAKDDAESARDEAQTLVDSISEKVEQIDSNTERIESLEEDLSAIDAVIGNPNVCDKSAVIQAKSTVVYIARDITVKAGSKYTITFSIPSAVANAVYCYVKSNGANIATANITVGNTSVSVTLKPTTDITDLALATQVTKDALVGLEVTGTVVRQGTDYISENADNISDIKAVLGDGVFSKVGYTLEVGGLTGTIGSQITFSTSTNYNRTCISVSAGELYKVTANVNANVDYPSAYFTDDNDIVVGTALGEALSVASVISEVAEAPTGATKLYVRDRNGIATSKLSIGKLDKNISEIVSELREGEYLEIPEYYVTHMESKVDTINDIANVYINASVTQKANQLLQFVFLTDYHYDGTGMAYDNTQNSASLIEYLQKHIGVDFVCHGGDIINNKGTQKEAIQYINAFRDKFGRVDNLYCCIGNHEYNSTAELTWAQITKLLNGIKTNIVSMDSYGDFCVDDKATKTRYIFMGCDRRSTSGAMISSGQITWFLETLADAPNDYDCLLFIHRIIELSFDASTETINASVYSDCESIANGTDAYNGHASVTYNGVTYDYSGKSGHFICALSGHSHTDASLTLPNGTPLIMVTTDCCPKRHTSYDWANGAWKNQATRGTTEEQAFDVVTVDKEHRNIYCTRIGYGADRAFTY